MSDCNLSSVNCHANCIKFDQLICEKTTTFHQACMKSRDMIHLMKGGGESKTSHSHNEWAGHPLSDPPPLLPDLFLCRVMWFELFNINIVLTQCKDCSIIWPNEETLVVLLFYIFFSGHLVSALYNFICITIRGIHSDINSYLWSRFGDDSKVFNQLFFCQTNASVLVNKNSFLFSIKSREKSLVILTAPCKNWNNKITIAKISTHKNIIEHSSEGI